MALMKPIEAQTLVIWGMRDRHIGSELAEPPREWVPNVRVERIAEATHWVQHDAAERVNELLIDFFADARS
jgi:pimeloyl-ACP methyl ester carboxylesterase